MRFRPSLVLDSTNLQRSGFHSGPKTFRGRPFAIKAAAGGRARQVNAAAVPGRQCVHHLPAGLSSSAMRGTLQQRLQVPQLRRNNQTLRARDPFELLGHGKDVHAQAVAVPD